MLNLDNFLGVYHVLVALDMLLLRWSRCVFESWSERSMTIAKS